MRLFILRLCMVTAAVFLLTPGLLVAQSDEGIWWCPLNQRTPDRQGYLRASYLSDLPDRLVYFRIDQGGAYGRLLDQRMSNLHYTGPGGVLGFARHVRQPGKITEWGAIAVFHYMHPAHKGTTVYNPVAALYTDYLRQLYTRNTPYVFAGFRTEGSVNMRYAPALGNSFLFLDLTGLLQPLLHVEYDPYFLERDWHFDLQVSFSILGYGIRIPEYGVTFQLAEDGGTRIMDGERGLLHPGNHFQMKSGLFYRHSIGGLHNPNWLRFGYVWDYARLNDKHTLNTYNASHRILLQLFFMMN